MYVRKVCFQEVLTMAGTIKFKLWKVNDSVPRDRRAKTLFPPPSNFPYLWTKVSGVK